MVSAQFLIKHDEELLIKLLESILFLFVFSMSLCDAQYFLLRSYRKSLASCGKNFRLL